MHLNDDLQPKSIKYPAGVLIGPDKAGMMEKLRSRR